MEVHVWVARHGQRIDFVELNWENTTERPFDPYLTLRGLEQVREWEFEHLNEDLDHDCIQTGDEDGRALEGEKVGHQTHHLVSFSALLANIRKHRERTRFDLTVSCVHYHCF